VGIVGLRQKRPESIFLEFFARRNSTNQFKVTLRVLSNTPLLDCDLKNRQIIFINASTTGFNVACYKALNGTHGEPREK
jgi:hypothetical protein